MHDGMLCIQFGNDLTELAAARSLNPGEHVGALDVVVELQDLAFAPAKRSEDAEVLGHIERKHYPLKVLGRAVPRFDPRQNRPDLGHLHQIVPVDGRQLPPLSAVPVRRLRYAQKLVTLDQAAI